MTYPIAVTVAPQLDGRDRPTTALRPILAIPHSIVVGPMYVVYRTGTIGLIGAAAYVKAIISWFAILTTGEYIRGACCSSFRTSCCCSSF